MLTVILLTIIFIITLYYLVDYIKYLRTVAEGKKPKGGSPVDGITTIKKLYEVDSEKFNESVQLKIWKKVAVGNYRNVDEFKKIVKSYQKK